MNDAAPTLVVVIPLTKSADPNLAINSLTSILPPPTINAATSPKYPLYTIPPNFTRNGTGTASKAYFILIDPSLPKRMFSIALLDAAKVADIVLFQFHGREDIDSERGDLALQLLRAQGLPPLRAIVTGREKDAKYMSSTRNYAFKLHSLIEKLNTQKPLHVPVVNDTEIEEGKKENENRLLKDKLRKALMHVFGSKLKQISWRERYAYIHVGVAKVVKNEDGVDLLHVSGYLRGRATKANRLLHITGFGTFVVKAILDQDGQVVSTRDEEGEDLKSEAEPDWTMNEQTWPPEVNDDDLEGNENKAASNKRKDGVSDYQATWIDELDEEGVEGEGEKGENRSDKDVDMIDDGDGGNRNPNDNDAESEDLEDMEVDEDEVKRIREAAKADAMFPDEVDTPLDQPARQRFAQYRGLKSMRSSPWDPKENLPDDYGRLYQFKDLVATRKRVLAQVDEEEAKGAKDMVKAGQFITFALEIQDMSGAQEIVREAQNGAGPVVAVSMLKFENRKSVMHFEIKRVDDEQAEDDVRAKDTLEFHCGFMRYLACPMFSEQNRNSDKHKMERYLRHGRYTVASVYGNATFPPAPVLMFHDEGDLVATGSLLGADPDRIVLKKIVLTGYVFKAQKRKATIRFMFFNPDDVRWFKPVELYTKYGRTGNILQPLGTHGYFKCIFDRSIQHHDTVCMSLYKRVYPEHPPKIYDLRAICAYPDALVP
eukprot:Plantae.Rhodophyta-Hildenbrandia_rubra.ctg18322.p1 GENE.Plantae.Rhodophyta-Hildenbrandia_rubra.ctg18322~~Plantae.Rhodophyta-Hildenbrandia_rubra.ctg18322.p1  ORF type:complete len:768 (-),score=162.52 Plantae.Rhodophyta-Hildenbrandia_rubra.ctg18322:3210-5345(-)